MAINDLNQKYTIEKYLTKAELIKALGTSLVEPFWKQIIEFRRRFAVELPLFDASRNRFALTYIDPVQGKTAQLNDRISAYSTGMSQLSDNGVARFTFRREMLKNSLKAIAEYNKLYASEVVLNNIVEGGEVEEQYKVLYRYHEALRQLKNNTYDNIDDGFLARNYAILRGEEELTSFYREDDIQTASSKVLIDRQYDAGVPAHLIDDMMEKLLDYINNLDVSIVSRLSAIFFMFNYIKPFNEYNMEIACLLAKRMLASTSIDTSCVYIPLESFINDNDFFNGISNEVKRTRDFTYSFLRGADLLNASFDLAINRISEVRSTALDEEVKLGGDEKEVKKEFGFAKPIPKPKVVETKAQIQARIEQKAVSSPVEQVSEKELKTRAKDLLEMNPFLKKAQANFYVHHCTMGRYYTIQQYVKFNGCVYETARTAMDSLAKLGYYRRDQIKNKFVYTPINKE